MKRAFLRRVVSPPPAEERRECQTQSVGLLATAPQFFSFFLFHERETSSTAAPQPYIYARIGRPLHRFAETAIVNGCAVQQVALVQMYVRVHEAARDRKPPDTDASGGRN